MSDPPKRVARTEFRIDNSFVITRGQYDTLVAEYGYCVRRKDDPFRIRFQPPRAADGSYPYDSILRAEYAGKNPRIFGGY